MNLDLVNRTPYASSPANTYSSTSPRAPDGTIIGRQRLARFQPTR